MARVYANIQAGTNSEAISYAVFLINICPERQTILVLRTGFLLEWDGTFTSSSPVHGHQNNRCPV